MNSIERLVMMANQIAANLMHEPDPAAATAQHIRLFWDPRMKQQLQDLASEGLSPTAATARALLAKTYDPA
jgi:formate dehydrogenase subunit delta